METISNFYQTFLIVAIFCPANQAEEVYIRGTRRFIPIFFPLMSSIKEQRGFV